MSVRASPSSIGPTRRIGPGRPRREFRLLCRYCQKEFTKAEHLLRHERSHTREKPFTCLICEKDFVRQDSLTRHAKLHHKPGDEDTRSRGDGIPYDSLAPMNAHEVVVQQTQYDLEDISILEDTVVLAGESTLAHDAARPSVLSSDTPTVNDPQIQGMAFDTTFPNLSEVNAEPDLWQLLLNDMLPGSTSLQASPHFLESLGLIDDPLFAAFAPAASQPTYGIGEYMQSTGNANFQQSFLASTEETTVYREAEDEAPFDRETGRSQEAVTEVRSLVSNLSSKVTSAVSSLSNSWLRLCLQMFWTRFIPSFPIMNRHTFDIHSTCAPLLLNMVAIGTLSLRGQEDKMKGVTLWRLVHKAVAGSWDSLLEYKSQYEPCRGVQLLQTALLGQIFATMSDSPNLVSTSEVFHGLGFRWAKIAGISAKLCMTSEMRSDQSESLEARWRTWTAKETLRRAILGHYILDGCLGTMNGSCPTTRHTTNAYESAAEDGLFAAETAESWLQMYRNSPLQRSFREIYNDLFDSASFNLLQVVPSPLSRHTILEGLFSLVMESSDAGGEAVGTIDIVGISSALTRFYEAFLHKDPPLPLLARWHHIGMIASEGQMTLLLSCGSIVDGNDLTGSVAGRRCILHAAAIVQIVDKLPIASTIMPHIALTSAIQAAAVAMCRLIPAQTPSKLRHAEAAHGQVNFDIITSIDWVSLSSLGLGGEVTSVEPTSQSSVAQRYVTKGGQVLRNDLQLSTYDVYPLMTVLTVFGQVWPRARLFAEDIGRRIAAIDGQ